MIVHEETSNHDEKLRLAAKQIFNTGIHPNIEISERNCVETFTNSQAAILLGKRHPDNTILGTSPYLGTLPVSPFFSRSVWKRGGVPPFSNWRHGLLWRTGAMRRKTGQSSSKTIVLFQYIPTEESQDLNQSLTFLFVCCLSL